MIRNFIKIAIRNLKRNKTIFAINILGLTFGLAVTSLIVLYVNNELTYDNYHSDSKNIYRLFRILEFGKSRAEGPLVNAPMGPFLVAHYPKVLIQTRVSRENEFQLFLADKAFEEEFLYADSSFFQIFTCKFIFGNPKTALVEPFSLVLSENMSLKLFGKQNPIGLLVKDENGRSYKITGVIENVPENSHLKFDILASFSTQYSINEGENMIDGWGRNYNSYSTYIKVSPDFLPEELNEGFENISKSYLSDNPMFTYKFKLQELEKLYLEYGEGGSKSRVILFSIIGFFVLVIACINYMNLNTADALKRLKEIGMRKVLGANRKQLIRQLLIESTIFSLLALVLALTLAEILLPLFNTILLKNLHFAYMSNWQLTLSFVVLAIITGILAGSYPAFYLSSIKPVNALKGKFVFGSGHAFFRNFLVIFQFAITIFLICCAGIIYMQIRHSNKADLGFNKENIFTLNLYSKNRNTNIVNNSDAIGSTAYLLKNELLKLPEIKDASIASGFPFGSIGVGRYFIEDQEDPKVLVSYFADVNFSTFLGLKLIDGVNISEENAAQKNNVLINETFQKQMGWNNPIGKTFSPNDDETIVYKVIGVVKDFHQRSFQNKILPTYISFSDDLKTLHCLGVKVNSEHLQTIRNRIEDLCANLDLRYEVNISYLPQDIEEGYKEEYRTGKMFTNFAILAIIIASMGLYGLALFISRQKTKEIGVRKVFGGSVSEIILILSKNFIKLVIISAIISIPVAWYYTDKWLQSFVYQLENRWVIFVLAPILAILIAFVTIFYQSFKSASANPVDAIKYE